MHRAWPTFVVIASLAAHEARGESPPVPMEPTPHISDQAIAHDHAPPPAIGAHLFVSSGVSHSFGNEGPGGENAARVFDKQNDSFQLDVAEVVLEMPAAAVGDSGFRIDVAYGSAIPRGVGGGEIDLQQAFATYIAPVGSGLTLNLGTFVTHIGAELIDGYDGYNDNYSRSILFGYAIPFAHTGVKASYSFTDSLGVMVMLANGWAQNVIDNNGSKSVGLQISYAPTSAFSLFINYLGGPEKDKNNTDLRHLADLVAVIQAIPSLTLTLNADWGWEAAEGEATQWFGAAATARYDVTESVSLALRGEYFDDTRGAFAGFDNRLAEVTLTPTLKLSDHFVVRGEVRHDRALDGDLFASRSGLTKSQTTAALNGIFLY